MALKYTLTAAEFGDLDEALQGQYRQDGDGHALDLDGDAPGLATATEALNAARSKVKEFRTNNTALVQERDTLQTALDEAKAAGVDTNTVSARLERMESKWKEAESEKVALQTQVKDNIFNQSVTKAAKLAGITEAALDDAVAHLRHRRAMTLGEGGKVEAEDGTTLDEALEKMRTETPYFFAESSGGGTPPGPGRRNPPASKEVPAGSWLNNEDDIISDKARGVAASV